MTDQEKFNQILSALQWTEADLTVSINDQPKASEVFYPDTPTSSVVKLPRVEGKELPKLQIYQQGVDYARLVRQHRDIRPFKTNAFEEFIPEGSRVEFKQKEPNNRGDYKRRRIKYKGKKPKRTPQQVIPIFFRYQIFLHVTKILKKAGQRDIQCTHGSFTDFPGR